MKSLKNSNYSRREFLGLTGLGLAGLTLSNSLISCTSNSKVEYLKFYGTGTLNINDWSKVKKDLNIDIRFKDNGNDPGPVIAQMIMGSAAQVYHIGGLQGGAERELVQADTIIPWDLKKIPNWDSVWDWAKNINYAKVDGKQYGLPIVINADSMIYLPEYTDSIWGGAIDSYAAIFDDKFKGRTSMEDAWINSVIFTAIYLKESKIMKEIINPGDLEEYELKNVMDFLFFHKRNGQFLRFWNGWEDGLSLIKSKQIFVMTGWEPIVYAAQQQGTNAQYAIPKEGYEGWSNDLILHKSAMNDEKIYANAHRFANWELSGYYGASLAKLRGYTVPNNKAAEYSKTSEKFDYDNQLSINNNVKNKFLKMKGNVYWQNVRPKNYHLYEELWSKLRLI
jgi:putative spermidine/putrescine transport system substrate-binding protein